MHTGEDPTKWIAGRQLADIQLPHTLPKRRARRSLHEEPTPFLTGSSLLLLDTDFLFNHSTVAECGTRRSRHAALKCPVIAHFQGPSWWCGRAPEPSDEIDNVSTTVIPLKASVTEVIVAK